MRREYYYNDAGVQIENLAKSVQARARGIAPDDAGWPEDGYRGDYIAEVARATAMAHGVDVVVTPAPRYGATVNHPGPAAEMRSVLADRLGPKWHATDALVPVMASEDFSYYLDEVPGAFALVGADDGDGHHEPCHSPRYDFNDRLIDPVAGVLARLAGAPASSDTTP